MRFMKIKFTFHGVTQSPAIEDHVSKGLAKVDEFTAGEGSPRFVEVWIKSEAKHSAAVQIELHLKTKHLDLHAHDEGHDLYATCDAAIEKLLTQIKRHLSKMRDAHRQQKVDKKI